MNSAGFVPHISQPFNSYFYLDTICRYSAHETKRINGQIAFKSNKLIG
jgi:hypothetical protein